MERPVLGERQGNERRPRDADHWARYVETLHVADAPGGASTLNIEGRRTVGPLQGFGKMWQKTYKVRLARGVTSGAVVETWRKGFPGFVPFGRGFRVPEEGLVPGAVMLLGGGTGVMVLYSDESSFAYMTPEGHPFSGWITFSAHGDEDGTTVAQAQLLIRANDPIYELMMPLGLHRMEDRTWQHTLRSLAAYFGASGEVRTRVVCVDPRRQWRNYGNVRYNAIIWSMFHAITAPLRYIKRSVTRGRRGGGSSG